MTLDEYYAEEFGPYALALQPLSTQLTRQALELMANRDASWAERLSPWVTRLGKGGWRQEYATKKWRFFPEISLYRHVADVGFLASYLLYWGWQSGALGIDSDQDIIPYVAAVLVIALFHDADKYVGAASTSPTIDHVRQVWDAIGGVSWLSPTLWPDFSVDTLHAAVSLVENRGQSQALLAPPLPIVIQQLAHLVGQADNFMSQAAVFEPDGVMAAWVATYRDKLPGWHQLYGVPETPLYLVQFHDEPAVLQKIIQGVRASEWFYPLIVMREGRTLSLTLPEDVPLEKFLAFLDQKVFTVQKNPRITRNRTNGHITLVDCEHLDDIASVADRASAQEALTIKTTAIPQLTAYLTFWAVASEGIYATHWHNPGTRKLLVPLTAQGEMAPAYHRALMMALMLHDTFGERKARLQRVLNEKGPGIRITVREALSPMVEELDDLDDLSLRTVVSLQAALLVDEEMWMSYLAWVHGPFEESADRDQDEGACMVMDRLRAQVGQPRKDPVPTPPPYQVPDNGAGTCLLCGQPAQIAIKTSAMELVGVKGSAFNNRIGHQKSLWSQSEANYLCAGCLYAQGLLYRIAQFFQVRIQKAPLVIALPVRMLWHTPLGDQPQPLRSFDAVAFKEQGWTKVLPWQSDQGMIFPLEFEEKPERDLADSGRNDDVLSQVWRLSLYAALSGEPVHVFTAAQRSLPTAFYYEPLPAWLRTLVGDLYASGPVEGVSRPNLPRWIARLELLRQLSQMGPGREALMDLPQFGWWVGAWLVARTDSANAPASLRLLDQLEEEYPMQTYSELLTQAAQSVVAIQSLNGKSSTNQWTHVIRRVMTEYQAWHGNPDMTRDVMVKTLAGLIYHDVSRSEDYAVKDERVTEAVDACLRVVEHMDQKDGLSSKTMRYLLAAFEMTERGLVRERIAAHQVAHPAGTPG